VAGYTTGGPSSSAQLHRVSELVTNSGRMEITEELVVQWNLLELSYLVA
jgi:hypothetical protein